MPFLPKPKRIVYRCGACGSERVHRDAWAVWNKDRQEWVLERVYTTGECLDCDTDSTLVAYEIGAGHSTG